MDHKKLLKDEDKSEILKKEKKRLYFPSNQRNCRKLTLRFCEIFFSKVDWSGFLTFKFTEVNTFSVNICIGSFNGYLTN